MLSFLFRKPPPEFSEHFVILSRLVIYVSTILTYIFNKFIFIYIQVHTHKLFLEYNRRLSTTKYDSFHINYQKLNFSSNIYTLLANLCVEEKNMSPPFEILFSAG